MSKSFKIARKPGQGIAEAAVPYVSEGPAGKQRPRRARSGESAANPQPMIVPATLSLTTRKTIEVPEDYFYRIKMRALERHILEKELWAEIVREYFANHPT